MRTKQQQERALRALDELTRLRLSIVHRYQREGRPYPEFDAVADIHEGREERMRRIFGALGWEYDDPSDEEAD